MAVAVFLGGGLVGMTVGEARAAMLGGGNGNSEQPSLSADGRYVVFASAASNLVPGDTNRTVDVFVRDTWSRTTRRVSVSTSGRQGNGTSTEAAVSADGRYVVFTSTATNLVPQDTNGVADVFVRDLRYGITNRVSLSSHAVQADRASRQPAVSGDGRYVAFVSAATNLVAGDTNGAEDVFRRDLRYGLTARVSVSTEGRQLSCSAPRIGCVNSPAVNGDGARIAFSSTATNLVPGDTNHFADVFVRDITTRTTRRVSVAADGAQGECHRDAPGVDCGAFDAAITTDGHLVAFDAAFDNMVPAYGRIFLHDLDQGRTVELAGDRIGSYSARPSISGTGRYVAFHAGAEQTTGDMYLTDRQHDTTRRVGMGDVPGEDAWVEDAPALSADGRYLAFLSNATHLTTTPTHYALQVYVRDLWTNHLDLASTTSS